MTVAEALVSDQNAAGIVAVSNSVHSRCNTLDINFHTGQVCFCFLKNKNIGVLQIFLKPQKSLKY